MVRIIVGTLLRVGTGFWTPEHVGEILEAKDRRLAGPKAPAEGLTLLEIRLLDFEKVLAEVRAEEQTEESAEKLPENLENTQKTD